MPEKKSPPEKKSQSRICFQPGCKRVIAGDRDVKVCRDHAPGRYAALQKEVRAMREEYGDDVRDAREAKAS